MKQKRQGICPKVPNGPQHGGKQGEKKRQPAAGSQQHIDAKLALGLPQGKEEQRRSAAQGIQAVQRPG